MIPEYFITRVYGYPKLDARAKQEELVRWLTYGDFILDFSPYSKKNTLML